MPTLKPDRIYLSPPEVFPADREAVLEAIDSGWIAPVGPSLEAFEASFKEYMGGGYAVALSSGTAALHLALKEVGVKPGDTVFCSTLSFVASANAIRYCGAEPVFIDSEKQTWNMDPNFLEEALSEAASNNRLPAAVEVVHVYGQCAQMDSILDLCQKYNVPVVEDAAEALGASYRGKPAGSFGRASAFSFNGNKLITTSGGGMFWTDNIFMAERVRSLSTQARLPDRGYLHAEVGYNYRLSNLLAALGNSQLATLEVRIEQRHAVFQKYVQGLSDLPGVAFMPEGENRKFTRWLTCLTVDPAVSGIETSLIMDALDAENIESRPIWRPLHRQPLYKDSKVYGGGVAEQLSAEGICLPSSGSLSAEAQNRVIATIRSVFS